MLEPQKPGPENYSPDATLTAQQHRIIALLVAGQSISQAAASEGLHRNTVAYWRRTVPAFARELEFATREQRRFWHDQAIELAPLAIQVLHDTLNNPAASPSLRFRAAMAVLKMVTDPQKQRDDRGFPTLPPESEALAGERLACQQEPGFVQSEQPAQTAQSCTKAAPQISRNALCPCRSGLKFKRCCALKAPPAAQPALSRAA